MDFVVRLSTEESSLIEQLAKFAEDNDFFESESDDKDKRGTCKKLQKLACRLRQKLAAVDESDREEATEGEPANLGKQITMQNGTPWWDVSKVRLGVKPFELRKRIKKLCGELAGLIFYSDSLDARQSMLEAAHMLRSAARSLKARASSDVRKGATNG